MLAERLAQAFDDLGTALLATAGFVTWTEVVGQEPDDGKPVWTLLSSLRERFAREGNARAALAFGRAVCELCEAGSVSPMATARAYARLAQLHHRHGQVAPAAALYRTAITWAEKAEDASLYASIAEAWGTAELAMGQVAGAIEAWSASWSACETVRPELAARVARRLSKLYLDAGQPMEALPWLSRGWAWARDHAPDRLQQVGVPFARTLELIERHNEAVEVRRVLLDACEDETARAEHAVALARSLSWLGRHDEALRYIHASSVEAEGGPQQALERAEVYWRSGDHEACERLLHDALLRAANDHQRALIHHRLGRFALATGDREGALGWLEAALDGAEGGLEQDVLDAWTDAALPLAEAWLSEGNRGSARELAKVVLQRIPDDRVDASRLRHRARLVLEG